PVFGIVNPPSAQPSTHRGVSPEVTPMYVPASFAETDTTRLHEFIRSHSFAILTSQGRDGLVSSHLPLLIVPPAEVGEHGTLIGHMARANSQWRDVQGDFLAVFSGPHRYISPTWYEDPGTVPTWNYIAVHVYGAFQVVEDSAALLEILRTSVHEFEGPRPTP